MCVCVCIICYVYGCLSGQKTKEFVSKQLKAGQRILFNQSKITLRKPKVGPNELLLENISSKWWRNQETT